jgi:hypothetical protein
MDAGTFPDGRHSMEREQFLAMVLIGASNVRDEMKEAQVATDDATLVRCNAICNWAVAQGVCPLWGIQQPMGWTYDRRDTNRSLRMLGGAGEVAKGSFKGL